MPSFGLSLGKEGITFRTIVAGERRKPGEWVVSMNGGGPRMDVTPAVGLPLTDPGECLVRNAGLGRTRKLVMAGADQFEVVWV